MFNVQVGLLVELPCIPYSTKKASFFPNLSSSFITIQMFNQMINCMAHVTEYTQTFFDKV